MVSLCFGREVCTRLGVAISGSPVFYIKVGRPVKCLAHAGLFSTTSHKCRAPSREAMDTIFKKVVLVRLDKGNEPHVYRLRSGRSNHYANVSVAISALLCFKEDTFQQFGLVCGGKQCFGSSGCSEAGLTISCSTFFCVVILIMTKEPQ